MMTPPFGRSAAKKTLLPKGRGVATPSEDGWPNAGVRAAPPGSARDGTCAAAGTTWDRPRPPHTKP
eukprot:3025007-Lingulodinium_polyedra.AAC.1